MIRKLHFFLFYTESNEYDDERTNRSIYKVEMQQQQHLFGLWLHMTRLQHNEMRLCLHNLN